MAILSLDLPEAYVEKLRAFAAGRKKSVDACVVDWIAAAVVPTTSKAPADPARVELPDSSFLLVKGEGPDRARFFPVRDENGNLDVERVNRAIAEIDAAMKNPMWPRATRLGLCDVTKARLSFAIRAAKRALTGEP